jgi:hypothetical protein
MRYIKRTTSNGSVWSEEDDQKLRAMYPSRDALELLQSFPERTWFALRRRAEKLGIERNIEGEHNDQERVRTLQYARYCVSRSTRRKEKEAKQGGKGHG